MRLRRVTLSGFAGVPDELHLDLDADVIVFVGANGFGKTTICDAIAWGLTGDHPRAADPRSLYSRTGETSVSVVMRADDGTNLEVRRIVSNPNETRADRLKTSVIVQEGDRSRRGPEADLWLLRQLLPTMSEDDAAGVQETLLHGYYMQQESLREFLSSRSDDQRFTALSQMVGAGSLSNFVREFDSAKTAWRRATNKADEDLEELRGRVDNLSYYVSSIRQELDSIQARDVGAQWSQWWERSGSLVAAESPRRPPRSSEKLVNDRLTELRRRSAELAEIEDRVSMAMAELEVPPPEAPSEEDLARLSDEVAEAKALTEAARRALDLRRAAVDEAQDALSRLRVERQELAAMAELALRHVGEECPACGRPIAAGRLRDHLEGLLARSEPDPEGLGLASATEAWQKAEAELRLAQSSERTALEQYQDAQEAFAARRAFLDRRRQRLSEVGVQVGAFERLEDPDLAAVLEELNDYRNSLRDQANLASDLIHEAEGLTAALRISRSESRLSGALAELREAESELRRGETDVSERRSTATRAEALLQLFRADADRYVNARLDSIQPLLDQLYASIDPHPTFRSIRLATRLHYGKHRLDPVVSDETAGVQVSDPGRTLSTSQANALAVALFLAFNLGLAPTSLGTLVLDDPLQNLDDIHLLGLVDMLRRVSPHRQLLLTTHDPSFSALLARKLRPVDATRTVKLVRLLKWDRYGPAVSTEDIPADPRPLKIASSG